MVIGVELAGDTVVLACQNQLVRRPAVSHPTPGPESVQVTVDGKLYHVGHDTGGADLPDPSASEGALAGVLLGLVQLAERQQISAAPVVCDLVIAGHRQAGPARRRWERRLGQHRVRIGDDPERLLVIRVLDILAPAAAAWLYWAYTPLAQPVDDIWHGCSAVAWGGVEASDLVVVQNGTHLSDLSRQDLIGTVQGAQAVAAAIRSHMATMPAAMLAVGGHQAEVIAGVWGNGAELLEAEAAAVGAWRHAAHLTEVREHGHAG